MHLRLRVEEVVLCRLDFLNFKIFINGGVWTVAGGVFNYIICMIIKGIRSPYYFLLLLFIKIFD